MTGLDPAIPGDSLLQHIAGDGRAAVVFRGGPGERHGVLGGDDRLRSARHPRHVWPGTGEGQGSGTGRVDEILYRRNWGEYDISDIGDGKYSEI